MNQDHRLDNNKGYDNEGQKKAYEKLLKWEEVSLSKVLLIIIRTTLSLNIFALRGRSSNLLSSAES